MKERKNSEIYLLSAAFNFCCNFFPFTSFDCTSIDSVSFSPSSLFLLFGLSLLLTSVYKQERQFLQSNGRQLGDAYLMMGYRKEEEIMYPREVESMTEKGILSNVYYAFSDRGDGKVSERLEGNEEKKETEREGKENKKSAKGGN